MTAFFLAATDYNGLVIPRLCEVVETVCWCKGEKVLRVKIDNPLCPEPLGLNGPINELLLSFVNPDHAFDDVGQKDIMVDILIPPSPGGASQQGPHRLGIGTLHKTIESALEHSSLDEEERQKWLDGSLSQEERTKWLDGNI